jgi:pyrimidine deaminase RibD-like protein
MGQLQVIRCVVATQRKWDAVIERLLRTVPHHRQPAELAQTTVTVVNEPCVHVLDRNPCVHHVRLRTFHPLSITLHLCRQPDEVRSAGTGQTGLAPRMNTMAEVLTALGAWCLNEFGY